MHWATTRANLQLYLLLRSSSSHCPFGFRASCVDRGWASIATGTSWWSWCYGRPFATSDGNCCCLNRWMFDCSVVSWWWFDCFGSSFSVDYFFGYGGLSRSSGCVGVVCWRGKILSRWWWSFSEWAGRSGHDWHAAEEVTSVAAEDGSFSCFYQIVTVGTDFCHYCWCVPSSSF